jgi:hypothetical protein
MIVELFNLKLIEVKGNFFDNLISGLCFKNVDIVEVSKILQVGYKTPHTFSKVIITE